MISVDWTRCCACGGCVSLCPEDALRLEETRLVVNQACTACGLCLPACPVGALWLGECPDRRPATRRRGSSYDLVVVGAGPAGSMAAWTAAGLGLSVLLVEKRQEIGSPVRCAEGVSLEALQGLVEPEEAWISARVERSRIVARAGGQVVHRWQPGDVGGGHRAHGPALPAPGDGRPDAGGGCGPPGGCLDRWWDHHSHDRGPCRGAGCGAGAGSG
jgi:ferredoxin